MHRIRLSGKGVATHAIHRAVGAIGVAEDAKDGDRAAAEGVVELAAALEVGAPHTPLLRHGGLVHVARIPCVAAQA